MKNSKLDYYLIKFLPTWVNRFSDEEILEHGFIAGYEIILKYIRQKQIDGKLDNELFYDKIKDSKPNLENDVMTVAEQWKKKKNIE